MGEREEWRLVSCKMKKVQLSSNGKILTKKTFVISTIMPVLFLLC